MKRDYADTDAWLAWLIVIGALAWTLILVFGMAGCRSALPNPVVTKVVTVETTKRCASVPPPTLTPMLAPTLCAAGVVCWTFAEATTLAENVEALTEWVGSTWELCKP